MGALQMVVFVAALGMAVDAGFFFDYRRQMHSAADAAAIAGALAKQRGADSAGVVTTARDNATVNGFTHGTASTTVDVFSPPSQGPFAGQPGYVEAIITQPRSTFFMSILDFTSMTVAARAVAGLQDAAGCLWSLHPTASRALWVHGVANVSMPECEIYVNSTHSNALDVTGSGCLSAGEINVTGGESAVCANPDPDTGAPQVDDPMEYLDGPEWEGCTFEGTVDLSSGMHVLNPGVYCGGIHVSSSATVTFTEGLYIIAGGGLTLAGPDVTSSGSGVTFYITETAGYPYREVSISGNGTIQLSAPTSGPWEAILFFQDRSIVSTRVNTFTGDIGLNLEGVLYFPTTDVSFTGGGTLAGYTSIIASTVEFGGNVTLNSDYSALAGGSPFKEVTLGE